MNIRTPNDELIEKLTALTAAVDAARQHATESLAAYVAYGDACEALGRALAEAGDEVAQLVYGKS